METQSPPSPTPPDAPVDRRRPNRIVASSTPSWTDDGPDWSGPPAGPDGPLVDADDGRPPRRWLRWLLRLVAAAVVVVLLGVSGLVILYATSPSVAGAPARVAAILAAHKAPSDNGVIPAKVGQAVLATEDSRFYGDSALDPRGVARAFWGAVTGNGKFGGATIEQQLAKLLYAPGTSYRAELRQVGVAFRLDQKFTKQEILGMYLDAAYFGDGAYGITAAAEHYFAVTPDQLTWGQASLLAGLVQAPTQYDPHGHLSLARQRQQHVLQRLVATHVLTQAEAAAAYNSPLDPAVTFSG